MATKREIERKYEVPVDFSLPDLSRVRGVAAMDSPVEHDLDATYYDTPQLRLAARRMTLRRRTGGDDAGWHLKRPAGADRSETQLPLEPATDGVPAAVTGAVRPVTRGEPLRPVARIRTRRLERPLRGRDGGVLALVADDVVASEAMGEQAVLQRWREVEVELVDGPPRILAAVDKALRAAGAVPATASSKLARALADRYPTTPADAERPPGAAGVVPGYLAHQRDTIMDSDAGVRAGDADAVHDMRVATRRLRSTLRTFRPVLGAERSEPLRTELRWLAGVLGAVRDTDVLAQRLAAAVAAEPPELVIGPVGARIQQRLAARAAQAREDLIAALDDPRYGALLDHLDAVIAAPMTGTVTAGRLRRLARRAIRRADERMALAERTPERAPGTLRLSLPGAPTRAVRLHEARKAYKRARYAVEVLRPTEGKPAGRLAKRLTALQDVLGAHQDGEVAGALLRGYGMRAHLDGDNAFTYGLLHARQRHSGAETLRGLPEACRRASHRKVRRWLSG